MSSAVSAQNNELIKTSIHHHVRICTEHRNIPDHVSKNSYKASCLIFGLVRHHVVSCFGWNLLPADKNGQIISKSCWTNIATALF